eukprot:265608_1
MLVVRALMPHISTIHKGNIHLVFVERSRLNSSFPQPAYNSVCGWTSFHKSVFEDDTGKLNEMGQLHLGIKKKYWTSLDSVLSQMENEWLFSQCIKNLVQTNAFRLDDAMSRVSFRGTNNKSNKSNTGNKKK